MNYPLPHRFSSFHLLLALVSFGAAGHAATFTVTKLTDTGDGVCDSDCSLREAITAANAATGANTVRFGGANFAVAQTISLKSRLPHLAGEIFVNGPAVGVTVEGGGASQPFDIFDVSSGGQAHFNGLSIRNGSTAIYSEGLSLKVTNCILSGNDIGIRNSQGEATVTGCTLSDNNNNAAIYHDLGTMIVTNCTLSGGSFGIVNSDTLTVKNCTMSGHSGDGILSYGYPIESQATLTVTDSSISAQGAGAGIQGGGTMTITHCTLSGETGILNDDGKANLTNCTLLGNAGATSTGVVNSGGTMTATNCIASGNDCAFSNDTDSLFKATNCTVINNRIGIMNLGNMTATACTLSGGDYGIYTLTGGNVGTITATNCTLNANTNGVFIYGGPVHLANCTVSGGNVGIANDYNFGANSLRIQNTLVVGNTTNTRGTITDDGHNITGGTAAEAGLQVDGNGKPILADNGGPTKTIRLLSNSPALDKGGSGGPTTDQRGSARPFDIAGVVNGSGGDGSDIGAFELGLSLLVSNPRSLPEGSAASPGSVIFDITLNTANTQSVTVNYQTTNGTNNPAIAGSDYVAKSGKLTFAPGETLKKVTIQFIGDSVPEPSETFFLDLKTPVNAAIADSRGVASIRNDDGPSLNIFDAVPVDEGPAQGAPGGTIGQKFIARLSAASTDTVTVDWATSNGTAGADDFVAASGTLTFAPGQTSKIITIQVNGDTTVEPNETYKVTLSKPAYAVLGDAQAMGAIRNDDTAALLFEDEPSQ